MSRTFKTTVLLAALCLVTSAAAQKDESTTTTTTTTQKSGVVETVYGNHVVLRDADGKTHEYTVPEDFKFQMNGHNITVANLQPGMKVDATITAQTTTRDVTLTRNVTGQVAQVAPGGIVVRDSSGRMTSFTSHDAQGKDLTILSRSGMDTPSRPREISWRQLRTGDRLDATIITTLPPQVFTKKTVDATVTLRPEMARPVPAARARQRRAPPRRPRSSRREASRFLRPHAVRRTVLRSLESVFWSRSPHRSIEDPRVARSRLDG